MPVVSGMVEGLLQVGAALGLERAGLLRTAALDEGALLDRDARLPLSGMVALGRAIIDARPGVNVGLLMLQRLRPAALGALGYALANCATLAEALTTFVRYQGFLSEALQWHRPEPLTLVVEASPELASLGHPVETAVGLWVVLSRSLSGVRWVPHAVSFRHAPLGDPREHAGLFGVAPTFGAKRDALIFDAGTLDLPVHGAELALRSPLLRLLEARLAVPVEAEVLARLRVELRRRLARGAADRTAVARALGMSARTLARRLQEAGTSYQAALEETRRGLALDLLGDPALAVYELAFLLGYTEPSTFHRAFRRWTGESPLAWRRARMGAGRVA
jgi:AraC-like DNA-binding protein